MAENTDTPVKAVKPHPKKNREDTLAVDAADESTLTPLQLAQKKERHRKRVQREVAKAQRAAKEAVEQLYNPSGLDPETQAKLTRDKQITASRLAFPDEFKQLLEIDRAVTVDSFAMQDVLKRLRNQELPFAEANLYTNDLDPDISGSPYPQEEAALCLCAAIYGCVARRGYSRGNDEADARFGLCRTHFYKEDVERFSDALGRWFQQRLQDPAITEHFQGDLTLKKLLSMIKPEKPIPLESLGITCSCGLTDSVASVGVSLSTYNDIVAGRQLYVCHRCRAHTNSTGKELESLKAAREKLQEDAMQGERKIIFGPIVDTKED
jgi:hypothetical protein